MYSIISPTIPYSKTAHFVFEINGYNTKTPRMPSLETEGPVTKTVGTHFIIVPEEHSYSTQVVAFTFQC